MRFSKLMVFVFLITGSCIDPLQIEVTSKPKKIVVDGLITDQPGPYKIELFYTNEIKPLVPAPFEKLSGAIIKIHDDLGNEFLATEQEAGVYLTDSLELRGQIGRSYYLTIDTNSGDSYKSSTQLLAVNGSVDDIRFVFEKDVFAGDEPEDKTIDALNIRMDSQGAIEGGNLFRWRWKTTIKVKTYPELRTRVPFRSDNEVPDPDPCSGYVYTDGLLIQESACVCCLCWSSTYTEEVFVSPTDYVSGINFNNIYLGKIPVTAMHFYDRYYISIEQLSLTQEAYDFWLLMKKQQEGTTSLFQPNAIKIRGNIRNINDDSEEVLGFFGVSSVVEKGIFISEDLVEGDLGPIKIVPFSCLISFPNATTEKPPFW